MRTRPSYPAPSTASYLELRNLSQLEGAFSLYDFGSASQRNLMTVKPELGGAYFLPLTALAPKTRRTFRIIL